LASSQYIRRTISSGRAEPPASSQLGRASLKVSQMWSIVPGPWMSASTSVWPGVM
jgi:hypothetical protein